MMNPHYSFWHSLVLPLVVLLILAGGYGIYKKNPHIMNPEPYLPKLVGTQSDVPVLLQFKAQERASEDGVTDEGATTTKPKEIRLSHRMLPAEVEIAAGPWGDKNSSQMDLDGHILIWDENSLMLMDEAGQKKFAFRLTSTDSLMSGMPAVSESMIIFTTREGKIYSIDRLNGRIRWFSQRTEQLLWNPLLHDNKAYVFSLGKDKLKSHLLVFDLQTGTFKEQSTAIDWGIVGHPVLADGVLYYNTQNGQLKALDLSTLKTLWSNELASSYKSGPTVSGERIYTLSDDGMLFTFERTRGRKVSEFELGTTSYRPLHIIDALGMGAVVDIAGYLVAFDLRLNKRIWRYNVQGTALGNMVSSYRMLNKTFELLQFPSQSRNWSLWTTCSTSRICLFEPKDGTLLHRIDVKETVVGAPIWSPNSETLWVPVQESTNQHRFKAFKPWKPVEKTESSAPVKSTGESSSFLTNPGLQPNFISSL